MQRVLQPTSYYSTFSRQPLACPFSMSWISFYRRGQMRRTFPFLAAPGEALPAVVFCGMHDRNRQGIEAGGEMTTGTRPIWRRWTVCSRETERGGADHRCHCRTRGTFEPTSARSSCLVSTSLRHGARLLERHYAVIACPQLETCVLTRACRGVGTQRFYSDSSLV